MVIKYRETSTNSGGRIYSYRYKTNYYPSGQLGQYEWLDTLFSPGPPYVRDNNFSQRTVTANPLRVTGYGLRYYFDNVLVRGNTSDGSTVQQPNWNELVNEALKAANPNKPIVDLPLFVFELRELPRGIQELRDLVRGSGSLLNPGSATLSYNFGWKPLLGDLRSLLDLGNQIEARLEALQEASKAKRYKANLPGLPGGFGGAIEKYWTYSNTRVYYDESLEYHEKNWMTTTYRLNPADLPSRSVDWIPRLRWALGLNVGIDTLWNAVPWTWMVDYFSTIGSYLAANRGGIPFTCTDMCIMSTGTQTKRFQYKYATGTYYDYPFSGQSGQVVSIEKRRRVYPLPVASIVMSPLVTGQQAINLAALAASAFGGSKSRSAYARGG